MSMSSFLHLLFDIVIISSVTRGLSQGGNLAKGALWPALRKQLEIWWWIWTWMVIL